MTQSQPRRRRSMTHRMTQAMAALAIAGVLGTGLLACGRYGPPQPYPPEPESSAWTRPALSW